MKLSGVARHSETMEEFVVYKALYHIEEFGDDALFIRPKEMFSEFVVGDGEKMPRFKYKG